jgi:hypothetical protein
VEPDVDEFVEQLQQEGIIQVGSRDPDRLSMRLSSDRSVVAV